MARDGEYFGLFLAACSGVVLLVVGASMCVRGIDYWREDGTTIVYPYEMFVGCSCYVMFLVWFGCRFCDSG